MSTNTIFPLPKESDTLSERVRKKVGIGMIPNRHWSLILTRFSKKGKLTWLTKKRKKNVVEESITSPITPKKKIETVNKTDKSKSSNKTVDTPKKQ